MDAKVYDVSEYIAEHQAMSSWIRDLEVEYKRLWTICSDVVTQSEQRKDETGNYMHYIEPGTWRRLVATVSVQTEMFEKGDE